MPDTALIPPAPLIGVGRVTLDQAMTFAKAIALARTLPTELQGKPADCLAIMLYGQDLGLTPMQSFQAIYVVNGKPQMSADLWTALARRAGHKVRWGACDDKSATVTIVRKDDVEFPYSLTFTIEEAAAAGLCRIVDGKVIARKGDKVLPWESWTARMLRNRVVSFAGKSQCPEVALGFGIEGDYDYIDEDVEVTPPEHHGDVMDAELVDDPEAVAAALDNIELDFAPPEETSEQ